MSLKSEDKPSTSSASSGINPLTKKLNKVLDIRLDNDKELLESLKSLSTFFNENSLRTRRNLRSDIEKRTLSLSQDFLDSFTDVKKQIDGIYDDVKSMNECCTDMVNRLKASKSATRELLEQTARLQADGRALETQQQVADAFLSHFQLSTEEQRVLRGAREEQLAPEFFPALERVQSIHKDCKVLLRSNQQTAGLAIMEQSSLQQEQALERLYRWAQAQCRQLTAEAPELPPLLTQALAALSQRPVLLQYCLDEYSTARRNAVVRGFIDALTRGGVGGTPRPIEMHSHDPLRYVGDMLAWLHQAVASEAEYLQALIQKLEMTSALESSVARLLGHVTESVSRPLKVRVEQVLLAEHGAVALFKLRTLLRFYRSTVRGLHLPEDCSLLETIQELDSLSSRMFHNALSSLGARLLDKTEVPAADLTPPASLSQMTSLVQEILQQPAAAAAGLESGHDALQQRRQDINQVLSAALEPSISACTLWASRLQAPDMACFLCNCLTSLRQPLSLHAATDQWLEKLQAQTDAHTDTLANEQAALVMSQTGLAHLYTAISSAPPKGSLLNVPGLDEASIRAALGRLDSHLAQPGSLRLPQCTLLTSVAVREQVHEKSQQMLLAAYTGVYQRLMQEDSGYADPAALALRPPDQLRQLLV